MPELPEVETVRRGLEKLIIGKNIISVSSDWQKSLPITEHQINEYIIGHEILSIGRRGKLLILGLDNEMSLLIHLRMTGQMVYRSKTYKFGAGHPNDSLIGKLPDKSTRVIIKLNNGSNLFFNDQRKFGFINLSQNSKINKIPFLKKMGPEPLSKDFNYEVFKEQLHQRMKSQIKAVLLDQKVIAGIGNIYADESLWMAKIHPLQKVSDISEAKLKSLYKSIIEVLELSIEKGGSTDRNYVDAEGKKGSYINFARVFRREGKECYRCGKTIIKIRAAGRGTHLCPNCQRI
jgi:formamidopyrimidine-DNA glycosylase